MLDINVSLSRTLSHDRIKVVAYYPERDEFLIGKLNHRTQEEHEHGCWMYVQVRANEKLMLAFYEFSKKYKCIPFVLILPKIVVK